MKKLLPVIVTAVVLVGGFVIATVVYKSKQQEKVEQAIEKEPDLLVRSSAKTMGPADAKVHIVEFMDPGCETCRAFHPFVQKLIEHHAGKVRLSVRYLPLHEGADVMVKILEAADRQGKYWEALHLMFASQSEWASHHNPQPDKIWPLLPQIGLDVERVRRDMNDPEIAAIIERDLADAAKLGARKTPQFFVNGEPLRDFGYQQLQQLVDSAVAASY